MMLTQRLTLGLTILRINWNNADRPLDEKMNLDKDEVKADPPEIKMKNKNSSSHAWEEFFLINLCKRVP